MVRFRIYFEGRASVFADELDIEDESGFGFYPELLGKTVGPLAEMRKPGRAIDLRTETKIFIYSFNK